MTILQAGHEDLQRLTTELDNFQDIAKYLLPQPGELPELSGFDVYGDSIALSGAVGGDHLIYVDFKKRFDLNARIAAAAAEGRVDVVTHLMRCRRTAGVALIDVSGHRMTDALLAAMLHQAFLLGTIYELDMSGHITGRLFENLNTRFLQSSGAHKYVSMVYGEISEDARFRFLSAGQPMPMVFSRKHDRFMEVSPGLQVSFPPVGMLPSMDRYEMNEWLLMGDGDLLLLLTDGVTEHTRGDDAYFPIRFEQVLRRTKELSARDIFAAVRDDLLAFAPPGDDFSLVVVKRTSR